MLDMVYRAMLDILYVVGEDMDVKDEYSESETARRGDISLACSFVHTAARRAGADRG
jgi:hypothetical protein